MIATPIATAIFQKSRRLRRPGRLSGQTMCSSIRITPMIGTTFVKLSGLLRHTIGVFGANQVLPSSGWTNRTGRLEWSHESAHSANP